VTIAKSVGGNWRKTVFSVHATIFIETSRFPLAERAWSHLRAIA